MRAGRAKLRSVHQLCDSLIEAEVREFMSLIVGLGSPHGDDQLGWVAIDRLMPRVPRGIVALKARGGVELLEYLEGHDRAIVIDASVPAGQPGLIRSYAWPCPDLARCAPATTHGLSLIEALLLAETLCRLPRFVTIHTIEARDTSPVGTLSADVSRQLGVLVESMLAELAVPCLRS